MGSSEKSAEWPPIALKPNINNRCLLPKIDINISRNNQSPYR